MAKLSLGKIDLEKVKWQWVVIPIFVVAILIVGAMILGVKLPMFTTPIQPTPGPISPQVVSPEKGGGILGKVKQFVSTLSAKDAPFRELRTPVIITLSLLYLVFSFLENRARQDPRDALVHIGAGVVLASIFFFPALKSPIPAWTITVGWLILAFGLSVSGTTEKADFSPLEDYFAELFFIGAIVLRLGLVETIFNLITNKTWYPFLQVWKIVISTSWYSMLSYGLMVIGLLMALRLSEKEWKLKVVLTASVVLGGVTFAKDIVLAIKQNPMIGISVISYLGFIFAITIGLFELARMEKFWPGFLVQFAATAVFCICYFLFKWSWYTALPIGLLGTIVTGVLLTETRKVDFDPNTGMRVGKYTFPWEMGKGMTLCIAFIFCMVTRIG